METTCRGVAPWVELPPVVVFRALGGLDGRDPERILNICCDGPTSEAYIAVNAQQRVGGEGAVASGLYFGNGLEERRH